MHLEWNESWDTGVVAGRVLQVILLNGTTPISDATMRQQVCVIFILLPFRHKYMHNLYFKYKICYLTKLSESEYLSKAPAKYL